MLRAVLFDIAHRKSLLESSFVKEMQSKYAPTPDIKPEECIVIADTDAGIGRAKERGIPCIGYYPPKDEEDLSSSTSSVEICGDLARADYIIEGFDGIDIKFLNKVWCHVVDEPYEILRTDRLIVTEMDEKEGIDFVKYVKENDFQDIKAFSVFSYKDDEELKDILRSYRNYMYGYYELGMWSIKRIEDVEVIGYSGLDENDYLGYSIRNDCRRMGYAYEATQAIIQYIFENTELDAIHLHIDEKNEPSKKLAEKLGFSEQPTKGKEEWTLKRPKNYM